jgi:fibrillarin-like pre-rRNA processing protein
MRLNEVAHNLFIIEEGKQSFPATKSKYPPYYGERKYGNLREWIPYRSKFAAMVMNGYMPQIMNDWKVLYLGAASGTTLSHFSDIFDDGMIYAVEYSAKPFSKLLKLAMERKNIIPILRDASKPLEYSGIVEKVDFIYQDVAHREQIKIFTMNSNIFLKTNGCGLIMVKARSIDSTAEPQDIFNDVIGDFSSNFKILKTGNLEPFHRDHIFIHLVKG